MIEKRRYFCLFNESFHEDNEETGSKGVLRGKGGNNRLASGQANPSLWIYKNELKISGQMFSSKGQEASDMVRALHDGCYVRSGWFGL